MDLGPTFGAALVGLVVEATLFGVTLLQTYEYYKHYSEDTISTKLLVAFLTLLDTVHLVLCARTIYWYLVTNFSQYSDLDSITWSMALQTDCNGIIGVVVQIFFARRLWLMSGNLSLTVLIVVLGFVHFGLGVVFTAQSFTLGKFSRFQSLTWITCTGLGSAAAADVLIAVSMCYYLAQKRTGIDRTDSLVTTLMIYSINTGLVTSLLALASVITFAVMPTNFIWLSFFWIMGKCYVNSFLALLNSRDSLRSKAFAPNIIELSRSRKSRGRAFSSASRDPPAVLEISIHTSTETRTEYRERASAPHFDLSHPWSSDSSMAPGWHYKEKAHRSVPLTRGGLQSSPAV